MSNHQSQELAFKPCDPLVRYTEAMIDGGLTFDQHADLSRMLESDPDARNWFVDYMQLHASLTWEADDLELDSTSDKAASPLEQVEQPARAPVPTVLFHSNAAYLISGWPLAYLIATVIFAIGAVVGTFIHVNHPSQVASHSDTVPSPLSPTSAVVGHITGMVDCVFEGAGESSVWPVLGGQKRPDRKPTSHQSLATGHVVRLGDTFAMASGLLEIIYDTGAKVVLQGPVAYEVDSANGGFLSLGKVTARVEKEVASDNHQSSINNQQSSSPQPLNRLARSWEE